MALSAVVTPACGCVQAALHPTPAVCGRPRGTAKDILAREEVFDRGFYSGPFGWLSGCAAEFVVAIRSALLQPHPPSALRPLQGGVADSESTASQLGGSRSSSKHRTNGVATEAAVHTMSLYAGVGIVKGSNPEAEWKVSWLMCIGCLWYSLSSKAVDI